MGSTGLPDENGIFSVLSKFPNITSYHPGFCLCSRERRKANCITWGKCLRQFWVNDQPTAEEVIRMETCVKRWIIQRTMYQTDIRGYSCNDSMQHEDISIVRKFSYSSIDQQAANPTNKSVFSKVFTKCPSILLSLKCSLSSVWMSWTDQCFSCDWFSKT